MKKVLQAIKSTFTFVKEIPKSTYSKPQEPKKEPEEPLEENPLVKTKKKRIYGTPFDMVEYNNEYYIFWGKNRLNPQVIKNRKEAETWVITNQWDVITSMMIIISHETYQMRESQSQSQTKN